MRGIDTNIVVRLLLRDDPQQVETVDTLVEAGGLSISWTVLIETEWVLRAVYGFDRATIAGLVKSLAMIDGLSVPEASGLIWACERYSAGADFTDMVHLLASDGTTFLTFDRDFARRAGRKAPRPVELMR